MPERREDRTSDRSPEGLTTQGLIVAVLVGIAVAVGVILAYQALTVLKLIAVAILLAIVLRMVVRGLEGIGASPVVATFMLLAGFGALGALAYFVLLPGVVREAQVLAFQGPESLETVGDLLDELPFGPDADEALGQLESYANELFYSLPSLVYYAVEQAIWAIAAVVLAVYFAVSPGTYTRGALQLVPEGRRPRVEELVDVLAERLRGWVVGTALVATCTGVSAGVGLWLLGVPLALTFGIITGLLDVIPLLGPIVAGALATLMALTISPWLALWVVALYLVINQVEGNILQPRIMGSRVNVPSALILVFILLMGTLLGPIIGALLAVPTAVVVAVLINQLAADDPPEKEQEAKGKDPAGDSQAQDR